MTLSNLIETLLEYKRDFGNINVELQEKDGTLHSEFSAITECIDEETIIRLRSWPA